MINNLYVFVSPSEKASFPNALTSKIGFSVEAIITGTFLAEN
jgi:hypothetical protein